MPSSPKRLLLVDDNPDVAMALAMLLRACGHEVRTATSAAEALGAFKAFHPDVLIADIGMPERDGWWLAQRIRENPDYRDAVLFALTAYDARSDIERSLQAGFNAHLTKPVNFDELKRLINAAANCCRERLS